MTILPGDFAADTSASGMLVGHGAVPAPDMAGPVSAIPHLDDLTYYLRHIEGGETIRALAREAGCHASTILRRIRRIEERRDDPVVDQALEKALHQPNADRQEPLKRRETEQLRRILRRLSEARAVLIVAEGMDKAIVARDEIRTAILDRNLAEKMAMNGWITLKARGRMSHYVISTAGREVLKAAIGGHQARGLPRRADFDEAVPVGQPESAPQAEGEDEQRAAQRLWGERVLEDPEDGTRRRFRVNLAESPLRLLGRRLDADGRPFLAPELIAAGERLRDDFELAQLGPRVAQNWDSFLTAGTQSSSFGRGFGGGSDSARNRVAAALRELGPGMGDLCLRVCCYLEGIETTERRLGWSARSGKIVLRLALIRLDMHYRKEYGDGLPLIG
ncbi:DUF6456 domain-containing protein [Paracoccus aminophilus]|uniref:DUF6456 domain-containing protein n=1 Tax=Paracoccus aminophilus JCM 7686 TaxID=1367847 RepID=S5YTE2_PARAH|nr:DUF6456 domain-containing protein [Paracoccus aminophilus]AGT08496.1 hypothetical protein JCM7686_1395 [Paracoccus aminophilus JCM 7686]